VHPAYLAFIEDNENNPTLTDPAFFPYPPNRGNDVNGGPTALAEFFGDFMMVNGKVWPKADVEPRNYRLRLLNGCDSRFLAIWFCEVDPSTVTDPCLDPNDGLDFAVIGSDQGLGEPKETKKLLFEPGARYDIVIDFTGYNGTRIIMANGGGDSPYGGGGTALPISSDFDLTDRIMAFDVSPTRVTNSTVPKYEDFDFYPDPLLNNTVPNRVRFVGLWEGLDEFGRLQPLQGTVGEATDYKGDPINWPNDTDKCPNCDLMDCASAECSPCPYHCAGLSGPMEGTAAWHSPTTENPALGDMEEWWIFNFSADAHPVHLHLVHLQVMERKKLKLCGTSDSPINPCINLEEQPVVQHMGAVGTGFKAVINQTTTNWTDPDLYEDYVNPDLEWIYEEARKDMVISYPGTVTKIRAKFD
jgi:FtsP/CotA-like multicopper oxidase with cupredoxin domain